MSDEIKLSRIEAESAKHPEILEAMGKFSSTNRFIIPKNKRSQAENSVNNVIVVEDRDKGVKYTITVSMIASGLDKGGEVPEHAEGVLDNLQSSVTKFLKGITSFI